MNYSGNKTKTLASLMFLSFAMIMTACAGPKIKQSSISVDLLKTYKTAIIHVSSNVPRTDREKKVLETLVVGNFKKKKLFIKVYRSTEKSKLKNALLVRLKIIDVHRVSGKKKALAGVFGGKNKLLVAVDLIDANSLHKIGSLEVQGFSQVGSRKAQGKISLQMGEAVRQVAQELVDYFVRTMKT